VTGFWSAPVLIAGPCSLEGDELNLTIAEVLVQIRQRLGIPVIYKGSFDKANRARAGSPRGPGLERGLAALRRVREESGLPVLTDVHEVAQVAAVAAQVDALQVPALLARQTDLLVAVAQSGKPVNIKKGQSMSPDDITGAVEKVRRAGGREIAVTERGTFFGYGDLVVDMRNFARLRATTGALVFFDATHAVQQPGRGPNGTSAGARECVPSLLCAAAGAGADGFFLETHPRPAAAPSDGATMWPLHELEPLIERALAIRARSTEGSVHA
jgi:2-dehydro-3-deoxyphosphooctonate aldolase (KDO 8-P synthase)